jgi:hypothetical protein
VVVSRVTSKKGLKILIEGEDGKCCSATKILFSVKFLIASGETL